MTCPKEWSTETLANAQSCDAEICSCDVESGSLRADACFYQGVYNHILYADMLDMN